STSNAAIAWLLSGTGYDVHVESGTDPMIVHRELASTLDLCWATIRSLQDDARRSGLQGYPRWPAIVLRTPKGWTGPKVVDGQPVEGTFRAHQVPLSEVRSNPEHLRMLEEWLRSYRPDEHFDRDGKLIPELAELAPKGDRRMGA